MNILVLGNGFDLAHGLPTKYTDFLEFTKVMQKKISNNKTVEEIDWTGVSEKVKDCITSYYSGSGNDKRVYEEKLSELIYDNFWLDYFIQNPMYQKENWIDFECEIGKVIQSLSFDMCDGKRKYELDDAMDELSNDYLSKVYSQYSFTVRSMGALTDTRYQAISFREIRDRLYKDLKRLIRALEIYLAEYIGKMECNLISPDIKSIVGEFADKDTNTKRVLTNTLCFNYTDTYKRLYWNRLLVDRYIDYIHGKADIKNTTETNNMVLGIDEYLSEDRRNKDIEFIAFKKFYQRIYKETGCKYREWVERIEKEYLEYLQRQEEAYVREHQYETDSMRKMMNQLAASAIRDEKCQIHNVYIFGHSLDITDGDILRDLILHENVHTTIFYYNKDVMGQQIANLVKVIGPDELIKRTGGSTKTIEFKKQADMVVKKE